MSGRRLGSTVLDTCIVAGPRAGSRYCGGPGSWRAPPRLRGLSVGVHVVRDGRWARGMQVRSWSGWLQVSQLCRPVTGDRAGSGPSTSRAASDYLHALLWLRGTYAAAVKAGDESPAGVLRVHSRRG